MLAEVSSVLLHRWAVSQLYSTVQGTVMVGLPSWGKVSKITMRWRNQKLCWSLGGKNNKHYVVCGFFFCATDFFSNEHLT